MVTTCLSSVSYIPRTLQRFQWIPTLYITRDGKELLRYKYMSDDIIFVASTPEPFVTYFPTIMCLKFKDVNDRQKSHCTRTQISSNVLRGIFINQSKYALESLKKYGFDSCDPVDTPMVEKSKLDEDKEGKAVDPSHYRGMIGTLLYLTASRPNLQFAICMEWYRRILLRLALTAFAMGIMLLYKIHAVAQSSSNEFLEITIIWSSKRQKSTALSSTEAEYIALSGCCAQILWMRSPLTDYSFGFNKIPMYYDNKSAIALCCNNDETFSNQSL
ncbi:hypothetical protein Tco_1008462 [Tanacetum coccineum]